MAATSCPGSCRIGVAHRNINRKKIKTLNVKKSHQTTQHCRLAETRVSQTNHSYALVRFSRRVFFLCIFISEPTGSTPSHRARFWTNRYRYPPSAGPSRPYPANTPALKPVSSFVPVFPVLAFWTRHRQFNLNAFSAEG